MVVAVAVVELLLSFFISRGVFVFVTIPGVFGNGENTNGFDVDNFGVLIIVLLLVVLLLLPILVFAP